MWLWPLPAQDSMLDSVRVLPMEYPDLNVTASYLIANRNPTTPQQAYLKLPNGGIGDGWCVSYAKFKSGLTFSGNAYEWINYINSQEPKIGDIIVLKEGKSGHLAYLENIQGNKLIISEQNYLGRWIVSIRIIEITYINILGYIES